MSPHFIVLEGPWSDLSAEDFANGAPELVAHFGGLAPNRIHFSESPFSPEFELLGGSAPNRITEGVLIVAAAKVDPPKPSLHFYLSILGMKEGKPVELDFISDSEQKILVQELPRLNTKRLVFIPFQGTSHGLVGLFQGEMETHRPEQLMGGTLRDFLPVGDFEPKLREYIDSAANLLGELPLNKARREDGKAEIGFAWPWGQGIRPELRAASLDRGFPILVNTNSIWVAGASALVQDGFRYSAKTSFEKKAKLSSLSSIDWQQFSRQKEQGMEELLEWDGFLKACLQEGNTYLKKTSIFLLDHRDCVAFQCSNRSGGGEIEFREWVNDDALPETSAHAYALDNLSPFS